MTQEDKQLLLVDLCARLPYGVKIQRINEPESAYRLYSIDTNSGELKFVTFEGDSLSMCAGGYLARVGKLRFKPYLRPLSSMTEEEKKSLPFPWVYNFGAITSYCESEGFIEIRDYECSCIIEWLNAHHFDFRNLIERGLAIDCSNLNIYD